MLPAKRSSVRETAIAEETAAFRFPRTIETREELARHLADRRLPSTSELERLEQDLEAALTQWTDADREFIAEMLTARGRQT